MSIFNKLNQAKGMIIKEKLNTIRYLAEELRKSQGIEKLAKSELSEKTFSELLVELKNSKLHQTGELALEMFPTEYGHIKDGIGRIYPKPIDKIIKESKTLDEAKEKITNLLATTPRSDHHNIDISRAIKNKAIGYIPSHEEIRMLFSDPAIFDRVDKESIAKKAPLSTLISIVNSQEGSFHERDFDSLANSHTNDHDLSSAIANHLIKTNSVNSHAHSLRGRSYKEEDLKNLFDVADLETQRRLAAHRDAPIEMTLSHAGDHEQYEKIRKGVVRNSTGDLVLKKDGRVVNDLLPDHKMMYLYNKYDSYGDFIKNDLLSDSATEQLVENSIKNQYNRTGKLLSWSKRIPDHIKEKIISSGDSSLIGDLADNHSLSTEHLDKIWDTGWGKVEILRNPNISDEVKEKAISGGYGSLLLNNKSLPSETVNLILKNHEGVHNPTKLAYSAALHPNANDETAQILKEMPIEGEHKIKMGTHRLRQVRDLIEEKGGVINKRELEKAGFPLKTLGLDAVMDGKGNITSDSVEKIIKDKPELLYTKSHDMYGSEPEIDYDDLSWDYLPDQAYNEAHDLELEKLEEDSSPWDDIIPVYAADLPDEVLEEYKNYYEKFDDWDDVNADHEEHLRDFLEEAQGSNEYPKSSDFVNKSIEVFNDNLREQARNNIGHPGDYSDILDNHKDVISGKLDETSGIPEQRHSSEESDVHQLNLHPLHLYEMNKAGVVDTYNKMYEASHNSSHPIGENGIGWVRHTSDYDGTHIDEIQSDFGQTFVKELSKLKEAADAGNDQAKERLKDFPEDHVNKINEIVFKNHHPSDLLMESFLQDKRDAGEHDKPVYIWKPHSKAPISSQNVPPAEVNGKPVVLQSFSQLKPEYQDKVIEHTVRQNPALDPSLATRDNYKDWSKFITQGNFTHFVVDKATKEPMMGLGNRQGEFMTSRPLPVHMSKTYGEFPKSKGFKDAKYGEIKTQKNPDIKNNKSKFSNEMWKEKVRKSMQIALERLGKNGKR